MLLIYAAKKCLRAAVSRMERVQMSYDSEKLVSDIYKGKTSAHRAPIDIITKKEGIEVKAFHIDAKSKKCRMAADAIERKESYCKRNKLAGRTVMVIVNDKFEVYSREGFGNFRQSNMEFVGTFKRPKKLF